MKLAAGAAVLSLLLAAVPCASAQERQLGARVGAALSTLEHDTTGEGEYSRRFGGVGGGFIVLPLANAIALQLEALYVQKGGKFDLPGIPETSTIILDYVEFPLLLRIGPSRAGPGGVYLLTGMSAGLRAMARRQFSATGRGITSGRSFDIRDEIAPFEASAIVGGGFDLHRHVVIDARYAWGLTPVNRDQTGGFKVRTRVLSVTAGLRF